MKMLEGPSRWPETTLPYSRPRVEVTSFAAD